MLWKIINFTLDHPMAPPDVSFWPEFEIFEQHWESASHMWEVSWDVYQWRAA